MGAQNVILLAHGPNIGCANVHPAHLAQTPLFYDQSVVIRVHIDSKSCNTKKFHDFFSPMPIWETANLDFLIADQPLNFLILDLLKFFLEVVNIWPIYLQLMMKKVYQIKYRWSPHVNVLVDLYFEITSNEKIWLSKTNFAFYISEMYEHCI